MSLNYTTFVAQLANLLVVNPADTNFNAQLPGFIDNGEQRCYRDLDLLATRVTDTTGSLSSNSRVFTLPTDGNPFLVVEQVNVITPATALTSYGTRVPLVNASRDFLDLTYPSNATANGVPEFWAMRDNATIFVAPTADSSYQVELVGTQRPTPLSSANSSTILTQMLPDLFMSATMIYASAYLKNYGAGNDDPKMAVSWEQIYQKQMQSALVEEFRKKYQSAAWTNQLPSPTAAPPPRV